MKLAFNINLRLRFLIISLALSVVLSAIVIATLHLYRSHHANTQLVLDLRNLATLNAGLIYDAENNGQMGKAEDLLRSFTSLTNVICVDYKNEAEQSLAAWPTNGCQNRPAGYKSLTLTLPVAQPRQMMFIIDHAAVEAAVRRDTLIFSGLVLSLVLLIFMVVSRVFENTVVHPITLMNQAMDESTPDEPVRAVVIHNDEIGNLVKTYNRMAAAARRYVRRLRISEQELRVSETRFRDMAEISGDWFFEMDAELRFTMISDRFFELVDRDPKDLIGKRRDELSQDQLHQSDWQQHIADLQARREFRNFEYAIPQDKGAAKYISISGKPTFDDEGVFIGYRGVGSDVTDLKVKERQLSETNRNFGDSVTYASTIQRALLPTQDRLSDQLGKVSAIWQPKDLVGGDFYWSGSISGVDYLVFFDCTGHGVPGAFMTLIVTSVIERIALSSPTAISSSQMVKRIHDGVCGALNITEARSGKDGLDCAVLRINRFEDALDFSGASIDLYAVSEAGEVTRHRGDRVCLGYKRHSTPLEVSQTRLLIGTNSFVLTTDGLPTQVGAESRRVMGSRRVEEALAGAASNEPGKLVRALARALKNWQGSEERRDDVSVLAFKPSAAEQVIDASMFG